MAEKGRFAPSPSGRMHLGNLFSFYVAWLDARSVGGRVVLRMEDLDPDRTGEPWTGRIVEDLRWLGLDWDEGYGVGGPDGPYCQRERTALLPAAPGPGGCLPLLVQPPSAAGRLRPPSGGNQGPWPLPLPGPLPGGAGGKVHGEGAGLEGGPSP